VPPEAERRAVDRQVKRAMAARGAVSAAAAPVISTYVHVITNTAGNNNASQTMIDAQIQVRGAPMRALYRL
jgi:hypothetical protein